MKSIELKRLFLATFAFLAFVACNCGNMSGYVVDMEYKPAHSVSYYNVALKTPTIRHIPDKYVIWVADRNSTRRIEIDKSLYRHLIKGQYVNLRTKPER